MRKPIPNAASIEIQSSLITLDGQATKVVCPSKECLLGDKLTAYAPHTTGIPYGKGKELEMAKQLFDVAALFDVSDDRMVRNTFQKLLPKNWLIGE